ncbi:MAG TPA: SgcJ/EcaC family oxidoreductase [Bryobacteraceae bacterium]|jgi:uncharacterized protein (TIGR02246 family)|nr:SgcJ/EcaC family oxidoreductase [Bryobacteraceae bacterium]
MKQLIAVLCAAVVLGIFTGCSETSADNHDADIQAIKDVETQWNKDFAAKDFNKLVAHYTDDAVFVMTGAPAASGIAAIQTAYKGVLADPNFSVKFASTRIEVAKSGDLAYSQGSYTGTGTDPATRKMVNDKGTYITVYKKQSDGSWKAVKDAVTSEVPPPAPEPEKAAGKKK